MRADAVGGDAQGGEQREPLLEIRLPANTTKKLTLETFCAASHGSLRGSEREKRNDFPLMNRDEGWMCHKDTKSTETQRAQRHKEHRDTKSAETQRAQRNENTCL